MWSVYAVLVDRVFVNVCDTHVFVTDKQQLQDNMSTEKNLQKNYLL